MKYAAGTSDICGACCFIKKKVRTKEMEAFDLMLAAVTILYGAYLFSGRATIFKDKQMKKEYDEGKVGKCLGTGAIVMGIATLVNWKFPSSAMSIGYVIFILVDFAITVGCMKKFCKRS